MIGINQIGTEQLGNYSHEGNVLIEMNYRFKIYEALKKNLEAIRKDNNFSVDINGVVSGDGLTEMRSQMICITQLRDVAVIEYQGTTVNRNSFMIRSQTKLRNLYITFSLYVKQESVSVVTDSIVKSREDYIDEIIKGLYGYNSNAQQLKQLLFTGCQNDFGLVAYEIEKVQPYTLKQDLNIQFEALFQYKLKYF